MNLPSMSRSKVIQIWFAAILLVAVAAIALGVTMTISTVALLVTMYLVPPALVVMLWPSDKTATMSEAIRNAKAGE
ncbi:MAG TPA: hypothetical protein VG963_29640 [Polyangiaceae bacterium]|nr:hypothetical protein [Polyangiaceae bacterium]